MFRCNGREIVFFGEEIGLRSLVIAQGKTHLLFSLSPGSSLELSFSNTTETATYSI